MRFLVLRTLMQSEIGWFGEVRRQGRETSRQRALNFDAPTVERLFPTASRSDELRLVLRRRGDDGIVVQEQVLRRQHKNWRLTGDRIDDARFGFVSAGDLFVMVIDTSTTPPTGAFDVLPADDARARRILARPDAATLIHTGLVALHLSEARGLSPVVAEIDPELFVELEEPGPPPVPLNRGASMTPVDDPFHLPPSAPRMFQVIGNLGHNLPVAVSDVVDNSIAARATAVDVRYPRPVGGVPWLAISDDGHGMDRAALLEAMRFGADRDYDDRDLGKYGIGLKAASLSQARCLTVASRSANSPITVLRWDQDHIDRTREWRLLQPALEDWEEEILLGPLRSRPGTVVLWSKVMPPRAVRRRRRRLAPDVPDDAYGQALHDLELHMGMVFHRFLGGRTRSGRTLALALNGRPVEAWDPFLRDHEATKSVASFAESVPGPGDQDCPVTVSPFVLPNKAQFESDRGFTRAGYDGRWNDRQGLYIYRADRMIQAGGWCDIWQRDEHTKYLRVAVSFDPDLDDAFEVNAAKMSVTLPPLLARGLKRNLAQARKAARKRYKEQSAGHRRPAPAPVPVAPTPTAAPGGQAASVVADDAVGAGGDHSMAGVLVARDGGSSGRAAGQDAVGATAPTTPGPATDLRLLYEQGDNGLLWRTQARLAGGREVRINRAHPLGRELERLVPQDHERAHVLASLFVAIDEAARVNGLRLEDLHAAVAAATGAVG